MKTEMLDTQERLLTEFPEINIKKIREIDIKIKAKVMAYQSISINKDISCLLQKEIKQYINGKNVPNINRKCNKLALDYLNNNRIYVMQENWYCLLTYFITIIFMIVRTLEIEATVSDKLSTLVYSFTIVLWLSVIRMNSLMGMKAEKMLLANYHAPSLTILSALLFSVTVCICQYKIIWGIIIMLSSISCIVFTVIQYKR